VPIYSGSPTNIIGLILVRNFCYVSVTINNPKEAEGSSF
jgi:hypothetical protein